LTFINKSYDNGVLRQCDLRIPNQEVLSQYKNIFKEWLTEKMGKDRYNAFMKSLVSGDVEGFTDSLGKYLSDALSCRDVVGDVKGENFYHCFMAALIASVSNTHFVDSNKESGKGYYDMLLTPKVGHGDLAILFEFKHVKKDESLEDAAVRAVGQIEEKEYPTVLERASHVKRVLAIGLAFCGKKVVAAFQSTDMETGAHGDIRLIKSDKGNDSLEDETGHDREEPPKKRLRNK